MYAELERIVCPKCDYWREASEFGKDATKAKGISSWCKPCKATWRRDHRQRFPEKTKLRDFKSDLQKNYGMSIEQHEALWRAQEGRCACCGLHESSFKRGLHVDHDHVTGQIRGLLCTRCNPGIGYFSHSTELLKLAIQYLEKFKN